MAGQKDKLILGVRWWPILFTWPLPPERLPVAEWPKNIEYCIHVKSSFVSNSTFSPLFRSLHELYNCEVGCVEIKSSAVAT